MTGVVLSTGVNVERISLLERCCNSGEGESVIQNLIDGQLERLNAVSQA